MPYVLAGAHWCVKIEFTMKQGRALEIMKTGRNVYLTGVAGSGKTHVLNEYIKYLTRHNIKVGVTASTGIAATHLGGITIHSWSGIGAREELSDSEIEELEQKEYLWKRFEKTSVLIIDEVSMINPCFFDTIDKICRNMKRKDEPFGGMQIVLSGDFFQLPPITFGEEIEFIDRSRTWRNSDIRVCYLDEQYRHKGDELEAILNEMRTGESPVSIKERLLGAQNDEDVSWWEIKPTRLFPHNANVDKLNDEELAKLSGREHVYEMTTKGKSAIVETLKKGVLAPEKLRLKRDALVMFVKNNFDEGYVNGTMGVVKEFNEGMPVVETFDGEKFQVESAKWSVEEDGRTLASVEQLPLRLAWAITVHKSQGMSMDAVEVDLSQAFVPGQGYVALSRLRSLSGLSLKGINDTALSVHPYVVELDKKLLAESAKWDKVVSNFLDEDFKRMQEDFILKCGGSVKPVSTENEKVNKSKISTYQKTRDLLEKGFGLTEIADERGIKVDTVISHIEELKKNGDDISLSHLALETEDLHKIREAFKKTSDYKLTPVYKVLKGKYSYRELRLARLFVSDSDET